MQWPVRLPFDHRHLYLAQVLRGLKISVGTPAQASGINKPNTACSLKLTLAKVPFKAAVIIALV
jgi:hypothetical protein